MLLWAFNDKWVVSLTIIIILKAWQIAYCNSIYYLTKINKTACDLRTAQMVNMFLPIRWTCIPTYVISLHPSKLKWSMAKLWLRQFAGNCNRDKVSSTIIFVTSYQICVLKKQFTQKWNVCHYLLLNAVLFHPVQVDQRISQCHWKRCIMCNFVLCVQFTHYTKHLISCSTRENHEGR